MHYNYAHLKNLRNIILLLVVLSHLIFTCNLHAQDDRRIAAFGSSVCNGTGDESDAGGYIGRFKTLMEKYNWTVVNVSRGGDNTQKIQDRWQKGENPSARKVNDNQYLLPQKPDFVIIGLSLTNEGIRKETKPQQDSVLEQFKSGMLRIIERCRREGFKVIVANCYPNSSYTSEQYDATKKMNLVINSWNLPSINLLGTIDDGNGHWVEGFYRDDLHPSSGGHREMYYSIVPTLFEAITIGKSNPAFVKSSKYFEIDYSTEPALVFTPKDTIHSYALSFMVRNPKNFIVAKIGGKAGQLRQTEYSYKNEIRKSLNVVASTDTLNAGLKIDEGKINYSSSDGSNISASVKMDPSKWYRVTISHITAKGETKIYIDDSLVIKSDERIIPQRFKIGLRGSGDLKDVMIFRSSLNLDEVKALTRDVFLQSSLEIYSPLDDESVNLNDPVKNLAQSLSKLIVKSKISIKYDLR